MLVATEFETKFQLAASASGTEIAGMLGVEWGQEKRQRDEYYDTADATLFLRGIFLRVRESARFQIKFNEHDVASGRSSGHTTCTEIDCPLEFSAAESAQLAAVMKTLGLQFDRERNCFELFARNKLSEILLIDKVRTCAPVNGGRLYLDSVDGLGTFLEVETDGVMSDVAGSTPWYQQVKRMVESGFLVPIDTGYNALYWRKRDFDIYMRGPYVMSRDRDATAALG